MLGEAFKFKKPGEVRVRIAPSPTGLLHIGLARTALFNYLFSENNQGTFVLRIEDTDVERSTKEFEKDILENLRWLGIKWGEGPDVGGEYGPYRQTERKKKYAEYLEKLLQDKKAYYCFCSEDELEAQRQDQMSRGEPARYSGKCTRLDEETKNQYLSDKKPCVIRFKTPSKKIEFKDLVRGDIEFDTSLLGDMVIAKDISSPLYNFAAVIDDFEMKISHVIRGEDHISNTPKQILLQETLGFPRPEYAHLPLILGPDKAKMSKRHGSVAVSEYRQQGYLPEALVNFMAFSGWNPGGDREIYSLSSLVKEFSLEKVQKGGAIFNQKRLDFINGFYIRQKSVEKVTELCIPYLVEAGFIEKNGGKGMSTKQVKKLELFADQENLDYLIKATGEGIDAETLTKIVSLYQERLKKLSEIKELADFFFKNKLDYDKSMLSWKNSQDTDTKASLLQVEEILSNIKEEDWDKENLEKVLMQEAEKAGDRGQMLWPLRVALSGKEASAGPFEIAEILGKDKTINRVKEAVSRL